MASFAALVLLAASAPGAGLPAPTHVPTKAVVSAQATVRILSGAKISLSAELQPEGYKQSASQVRLEDGSLRPAQLVEFQ